MLKQYTSNKFQLECKKKQRENISEEIYEVHTPNCIQVLSDMPKGSSTSDSTGDTAIRIISEKEKALQIIDKDIKKLEQEIKIVDSLIATLKHKDQIFIKKIIVERKQLTEVEYEMNYSNYKNTQRAYTRIMEELEEEFKKS